MFDIVVNIWAVPFRRMKRSRVRPFLIVFPSDDNKLPGKSPDASTSRMVAECGVLFYVIWGLKLSLWQNIHYVCKFSTAVPEKAIAEMYGETIYFHTRESAHYRMTDSI